MNKEIQFSFAGISLSVPGSWVRKQYAWFMSDFATFYRFAVLGPMVYAIAAAALSKTSYHMNPVLYVLLLVAQTFGSVAAVVGWTGFYTVQALAARRGRRVGVRPQAAFLTTLVLTVALCLFVAVY